MGPRDQTYVGPWLPEPLFTVPDVADRVDLVDSISIAMMVVLEALSPLERAVLVLHEAFGFPHPEIAAVLGRSEPAVRQLARRACEHVRQRRPRFETDQAVRREVTERFVDACERGDLAALLEVLAPDVVLIGDGGGIGRAPRRPVHGADRVARFLVGARARPVPELRVAPRRSTPGPGCSSAQPAGC